MRSLIRRIDIFCMKHPHFGIKNLMLYVIVGNVICFVFGLMDTTGNLVGLLAFDAQAVFTKGEVWRLLTFALIPENMGLNNLLWFVVEMYFYYFIGNVLEAAWGKGKFTIYYLCGMLCAILYGILLWAILGFGIPVTMLYANTSMFFAFATLFPDTILRVFFIIPLKAKWIAWVEAAIFIVFILTAPVYLKLLPVVAILNYLLFCGGWLFDRMKPKNIKARQEQTKRTVQFKTAAREYKRRQSNMPYTRKCEVCGKTDKDNPDLEFRFCSRCGGYHCFCIDHINNHVHFTE